MEQSPSWEANRFSASQEIPRVLWNPKVHYSTHKSPPPVLKNVVSNKCMLMTDEWERMSMKVRSSYQI
jgi:hypothetical protein